MADPSMARSLQALIDKSFVEAPPATTDPASAAEVALKDPAVAALVLSFLSPTDALSLNASSRSLRCYTESSPAFLKYLGLTARGGVPLNFSTRNFWVLFNRNSELFDARKLMRDDGDYHRLKIEAEIVVFKSTTKRLSDFERLKKLLFSVTRFPDTTQIEEFSSSASKGVDWGAVENALGDSNSHNKTLLMLLCSFGLNQIPTSFEYASFVNVLAQCVSIPTVMWLFDDPTNVEKLKDAVKFKLSKKLSHSVRRSLFHALITQAEAGPKKFLASKNRAQDRLWVSLLKAIRVGDFLNKTFVRKNVEVVLPLWGRAVSVDGFKRFRLVEAPSTIVEASEFVITSRVDDSALKLVSFFVYATRNSRYPKTKAFFKASRFQTLVLPMLKTIASSNDFATQPCSQKVLDSDEYDASLIRERIDIPVAYTLNNYLSLNGSNPESWEKLSPRLSINELAINLVSLVLNGVDCSKVRCEPKDLDQVFRLLEVINSKLSVRAINVLKADCGTVNRAPDRPGWMEFVRKKQVKNNKGELQVTERKAYGSDKFFEAAPEEVVARLVSGYEAMAFKALNSLCEKSKSSSRSRLLVPLTRALRRNPLRTGAPPKVPTYSHASLWRGETMDLSFMSKIKSNHPDFQLLAGITWCQTENGRNADVDLSLTALTSDLNKLYHCSYTSLTCPGMTHSGDLTSAPFPDGARESVRIEFGALSPDVKYVLIQVYDYSSTGFDNMHDASFFLANPGVAGTGPGGTDVFLAARLTGAQRVNTAAVLVKEDNGEWSVVCLDHSSRGGADVERNEGSLKDLLRAYVLSWTCDFPLARKALFDGIVRRRVDEVEFAGSVLTREKNESIATFFNRSCEWVSQHPKELGVDQLRVSKAADSVVVANEVERRFWVSAIEKASIVRPCALNSIVDMSMTDGAIEARLLETAHAEMKLAGSL